MAMAGGPATHVPQAMELLQRAVNSDDGLILAVPGERDRGPHQIGVGGRYASWQNPTTLYRGL